MLIPLLKINVSLAYFTTQINTLSNGIKYNQCTCALRVSSKVTHVDNDTH